MTQWRENTNDTGHAPTYECSPIRAQGRQCPHTLKKKWPTHPFYPLQYISLLWILKSFFLKYSYVQYTFAFQNVFFFQPPSNCRPVDLQFHWSFIVPAHLKSTVLDRSPISECQSPFSLYKYIICPSLTKWGNVLMPQNKGFQFNKCYFYC